MTAKRTCAIVYAGTRRRPCIEDATMVRSEGDYFVHYCIEHALESEAVDLDPTAAARAEAVSCSHNRVSPDAMLDSIAAVKLYVEAFAAGAPFAAARREGLQ